MSAYLRTSITATLSAITRRMKRVMAGCGKFRLRCAAILNTSCTVAGVIILRRVESHNERDPDSFSECGAAIRRKLRSRMEDVRSRIAIFSADDRRKA